MCECCTHSHSQKATLSLSLSHPNSTSRLGRFFFSENIKTRFLDYFFIISIIKKLLQQASRSLISMEEDYYVLQKQVELLTKKMQELMQDNQRLTLMVRGNDTSFVSSQTMDIFDVSQMTFGPSYSKLK